MATAIETIELTLDQQTAFEYYKQGLNIFVTGSGGTGKSALVNKIKNHAIGKSKQIAITATTGAASLLINGRTIFSWAGIQLGTDPVEKLLARIRVNKDILARWTKCDILVIDEISMLDSSVFEKLMTIKQTLRPALQLILVGDFLQLLPVSSDRPAESKNLRFSFETAAWAKNIQKSIQLTTIKRQTHPEFCRALQEIRIGATSPETIKLLESRLIKNLVPPTLSSSTIAELGKNGLNPTIAELGKNGIYPTVMYANKKTVSDKNAIELLKLKKTATNIGTVKTKFHAKKTVANCGKELNDRQKDYLITNTLKSVPCEDVLELAVGAQCMVIYNIGPELVNGSRGVVTELAPLEPRNEQWVKIRLLTGAEVIIEPVTWNHEIDPHSRVCVRITQIPLILAYSMTIHKSMGSSIDYVMADLGASIFAEGQMYVALSRVRSLEGLFLSDFDPTKVLVNAKVKQYYSGFKNS